MAKDTQVKAVVNLDVYRWHPSGEPGSHVEEAYKGDKIEVSAAEFDRAQKMAPAGLAKAGSEKAKAATVPPSTEPLPPGPEPLPDDLTELSDAELKQLAESRGLYVGEDLTRDELLAAVVDAPGAQNPNA